MRKTFVFICLIGLVLPCFGSAAGAERVKAFYLSYIHNFLDGTHEEGVALCEQHMTKALIEKMERAKKATDADQVLRAQGCNEDALETLTVRDLGDNWYMVKYLWDKQDQKTQTEIPVKAHTVDGRFKIVYIAPSWNGTRHGDGVFPWDGVAPAEADQSSGISFLTTFYKLYVSEYCRMGENVQDHVLQLRDKHLSAAALRQFAQAAEEYELDGLSGYDLLVKDFDFDGAWYDSIVVTALGGERYRVEYKDRTLSRRVNITLVKEDGRYLVQEIH